MSTYSAGIPSSFDPALLCSEYDQIPNAPTALSHSDDLEALQACIAEDTSRKTKEGVVIQHRAWNLVDIFRSEGEACSGTGRADKRDNQY
jgi:chromosome transmission fidelity protein 18